MTSLIQQTDLETRYRTKVVSNLAHALTGPLVSQRHQRRRTMTASTNPVLMTLPYLPLTEPVEFSGYWLGPLKDFAGPWRDEDFASKAEQFMNSFRDASGAALKPGALLVPTAAGADGVGVDPDKYQALRLSIGFAAIDQNPTWSPDTQDDTWRVATADNADLWMQPIDTSDGWIALDRGGRVTTTVGGMRLTDEAFEIRAPLELHMPTGIRLDDELLAAVYGVLTAPPTGCDEVARRLRVTLGWLLRSWQNSPSQSWEDRLVAIKVASEAMTGKDRSHEAAAELERLFRDASAQPGDGHGLKHLLWRLDGPVLTRSWTTRGGKRDSKDVSEFEHWYGALADARNAIVHGDDDVALVYEEPSSHFTGPFVEVADRVMREAVLVQLGECGFPAVWRKGIARASFDVLRKLLGEAGEN